MTVRSAMTSFIARFAPAITLAGLVAACAPPEPEQTAAVSADPLRQVVLSPPGAGSMGVFDPSIASDGGGAVHMAFSAVDPATGRNPRSGRIVTTFLARSDDSGGRWSVIGGPVNPVRPVTLGRDAGGGAATWHNEVPALLYDPYAAPPERWKLVWHHYLIAGERRLFEHGWIGYRSAGAPDALVSAPEIKLFGGLGYAVENDDPGGPTRSPVAGPPQVPLHTRHPDLARCAAFTEPALAARASALLLALNCAEFGPGGISPKIVLLRCARPCQMTRPEGWDYVGTLLTSADAGHFGAKGFSAADIHSVGGLDYLIASPTSDRPFPDAYNGCIGFRFTDLERGRLQRLVDGRPVPAMTVAGTPNSFNGACAADVGVYGGRLLIGEVELRGGAPRFEILVSGVALQ